MKDEIDKLLLEVLRESCEGAKVEAAESTAELKKLALGYWVIKLFASDSDFQKDFQNGGFVTRGIEVKAPGTSNFGRAPPYILEEAMQTFVKAEQSSKKDLVELGGWIDRNRKNIVRLRGTMYRL